MQETITTNSRHIYIIFNPVAGTTNADQVYQAFEHHFATDTTSYEVYETTGDEHESIKDIASKIDEQRVDMAVAAGGDGTVSEVASGLIHRDVPMGIIPTGTANVLAQELGIPLKLDEACHLIAEAHDITSIDAMKTGDTIAVLHMGVGLDAELIRQTRREQKRRFGRLAYIWNGLIQIIGYQPRRFSIAADNVHKRFHAANVQIANGGSIGMPILRWGQHIRPDDGQIDVCIVYARNFLDYLKLAGYILLRKQKQSRRIRYLAARRSVAVHCDKPLPVHADGETIGETPVSVQVIPQAVRIAIPRTSQPDDEPQPAETAVELA